MITLTIKRADGSIYWVDYFNNQADCDRWLAEEQTRPYWSGAFTWEVVDSTPPPPTAEEAAALASVEADRRAAAERVDALNPAEITTLDAAVSAIADLLTLVKGPR